MSGLHLGAVSFPGHQSGCYGGLSLTLTPGDPPWDNIPVNRQKHHVLVLGFVNYVLVLAANLIFPLKALVLINLNPNLP